MLTLEQSKVGLADKFDQMIIDEFRRASWFLNELTFDNAVSPGTGGSTLTYGYQRLVTPGAANFREINKDYDAAVAIREPHYVDLKIFGGKAGVDRILEKTAAASELDFQLRELINASTNLFHHTFINGDKTQNPKEFDGLDIMLTGTSTEFNRDGVIDLTAEDIPMGTVYRILEQFDQLIQEIQFRPDFITGNTLMITKLMSLARRAGYLTPSEDAFGRRVWTYQDIPLINSGNYYSPKTNRTEFVVPIAPDGTTSLYMGAFGIDRIHGVSPLGDRIIQTYSDGLDTTGVIRNVEVEAAMAVVLKNSLAGGVVRNIKVKAVV